MITDLFARDEPSITGMKDIKHEFIDLNMDFNRKKLFFIVLVGNLPYQS